MFKGKTLLITGGTGTFGNAVLKRFLKTAIAEIRVLSRDEKKQEDMRLGYDDPKLKFYIGDVREYSSVATAMAGVDYVFHAAALKQVPSCEFYPLEAIRTNTLGAENVMNAAIAHGVARLIVLSTDKAVYPINAMGMSKALMEKLMVAKARFTKPGSTILCGTRYGNVMASRGSVIPLFIKQVKEGRPLTVTDPLMTRFLMSIDDAVDLVLYAYKHGQQGDLFVQKAPAATIETLARAVRQIFNAPNPVEVIGTRHGEKVYETLVTREELAKAEDAGQYFRVASDNRDLNYSAYFTEGQQAVSRQEDYHSHNARRLDVAATVTLLMGLDLVQEELVGWSPNLRELRGARMKVMTILGTRPEIIRLSAIIPMLDEHCTHIVVHTGQNYDDRLNGLFFREMRIREPDEYMGVRGATFSEQVGQILARAEALFMEHRPDRLLVLGDTNSGLTAIVARRLGIPVFHMEAGNRCYDDRVPEEVNRRVIDHSSSVLLPYTNRSRENLLREGLDGARIFVTGNPIRQVLNRYAPDIAASDVLSRLALAENSFLLVTMHRAENVDRPDTLNNLVEGLRRAAAIHGFPVVCSMHPRTRSKIEKFRIDISDDLLRFVEPLGFFDFVRLEQTAFCVLSDSGTVQEETSIFRRPNVTLREVTERPETVDCGSNFLAGTDPGEIVRAVEFVTSRGTSWNPPVEYEATAVSETVCRILLGFRPSDAAGLEWARGARD